MNLLNLAWWDTSKNWGDAINPVICNHISGRDINHVSSKDKNKINRYYCIGSILDQMGIAVRTGHHCAQPIMDFYNIPGTVRASFSFYNTFEEIDILDKGIRKAILMLQ